MPYVSLKRLQKHPFGVLLFLWYDKEMKEPFIIGEQDLPDMARRIVDTLGSSGALESKVLFLEGDLGAGKTTFTKEIAEILGVRKDEVHSPTFILKKEYSTNHSKFKKLIHVDAYRFDTPKEANVLNLSQDKEKGGSLIVIEWPSKLGGAIEEDMTVSFSVLDDTSREVVVHYVAK